MKKLSFCFAVMALSIVIPTFSQAADFPTKPIQLVVPYPPGAGTDITARGLAPKLSKILGQQVVVVNKTGGGGAIGIQAVAAAEPDGHTLLCTPAGIIIIPLTTPNVPFTIQNFTPLNLATSIPIMIVVKKDSPIKNIEEIIKRARKDPGKLTFASAGKGTMVHLVGEMFKNASGADITHVPMAGQAGSVTAVLGGHVDLGFIELSPIQGHLEAGEMIGLATMGSKRMTDLSNIPTIVELGFPTSQSVTWYGIFAPAKTPPSISNRLSDAFEQALKDPDVISALKKAKITIENLNKQEFSGFLQREMKKWTDVVEGVKTKR